jgi:hypothetical protein
MYGPTADQLYGGGPALGEGNRSGPPLKMVAAGQEAPRPNLNTSPNAAAMLTGITDDPAFWLVATLGAAIFLARASAR